MACPETDTTLLWAWGEADDTHAAHVAACPECAALVAEQEALAGLLAPVLPAVAPARRPSRAWLALPLALAAAVLLALVIPGEPPAPTRVADTDLPPLPALSIDPVDAAFDDLERELAELRLDLEIL